MKKRSGKLSYEANGALPEDDPSRHCTVGKLDSSCTYGASPRLDKLSSEEYLASGYTLTVTCTSCGSYDVNVAVWTALHLTSNTAINGTGGDCAAVTFSVTAGDYWFAVGHAGGTTGNFCGSTQSPTAETIITGANGVTMIPADMTIASTNAAFSNAYSNCDKFSLATWH